MKNIWAKLYGADLACLAVLSLSIALALSLSACSAPAGQPSDAGNPPASEQSPAQQENPPANSSQEKPEGLWEKNKDLGFDVVPASQQLDASQLEAMLNDGTDVQVIDIRSAGRFSHAYIDGSRNIPAGRQFELRSDEIRPEAKVVLVSSENDNIGAAWQTLMDLGFKEADVYVLSGGIQAWQAADLPTKQREHMGC